MKIDPHKQKEKYLRWKEQVVDGIPNISKENSDIILRYTFEMEKGINVAAVSAKGGRSFIRLNTLKGRMIFFAKKFKEIYNLNLITDITEEQLVSFFSDMKNGIITREDGKNYISVETLSKIFKAFWHWHQKVNHKKGIEISDITADVDVRQGKPKWVYLNEAQVKHLCNNANFKYKVLIMFLFDTGIRSPTELVNIKVSDLYNKCKEVHVREEISKTFGRKIKLMLCSDMLLDHIEQNSLKPEDYLFSLSYSSANKYLKRLAVRLFGDGKTEAGGKYS